MATLSVSQILLFQHVVMSPPASLLPLSKNAGTTGTQPDYPINLFWEQGGVVGGREAKGGDGGRKDYGAQRKGKKGEWKRPLRNRSRRKMYGAEWVNSVFKKHTATKMAMKWTEELEATCIMKIGEHLVWQHEELWGWKTHTKWHTESRQRLGHQRLFT